MAWKVTEEQEHAPFRGASQWLYAVRTAFQQRRTSIIRRLELDGLSIEIRTGAETLWMVPEWPSQGRLAIRMAYTPDGLFSLTDTSEVDGILQYRIASVIGQFRTELHIVDPHKSLVHFRTWLTPEGELNIPFWPSDTYPMNADYDPLNTRGEVHAAQRGYSTAFMYMSLTEPRSGSLLYLQDLTSLNEYCEQTHTVPNTRMGGSWPELGYTIPIAERMPLVPGKEVVVSDGYLRFTDEVPEDDGRSARLFMQMLSEIYLLLPKPETRYHDWTRRTSETIEDLQTSPDCTRDMDGRRYLNGYVGTGERRPESLVQLTVLLPMLEYEAWSGTEIPLAEEIRGGLGVFYDPKIRSILRYPESMQDMEPVDKDERGPWELDSWYLYHPLIDIGRLARDEDENAKQLLLDSLDYAVKAAQHFEYRWPILFNAQTLDVIRQGLAITGEEESIGEADVAGLYAYLMYLAWDITRESRYLEECKKAAATLAGLHFNFGYQFNNTAWAANALVHLWRLTGEQCYLDLSQVAIASIFQNVLLWECDYGHAKDYSTFFGATPLREGFYLAMYEEAEIFAAFHEYLTLVGEHCPPALQLLLAEYCKYALHRTWCYYPSELPEEVIAEAPRNGHIDRNLAIPLEDIYQGWEQAGQLGQEIYGSGAPLAYVTRSYHRVENTPFMVFCDYPITSIESNTSDGSIAFQVRGSDLCRCRVRLIPDEGKLLPDVSARVWCTNETHKLEGLRTPEGHIEYSIPGDCKMEITCKGES